MKEVTVVTKRNGEKEAYSINKIQNVIHWACEGLNDDNLKPIKDVSASTLEMSVKLQLYSGIPTKAVHESIIKTAADLISIETPNYDHVAARLIYFIVRKEAYGQHTPPHLYEIVKRNVAKKMYTEELLDMYTEEEFDELNSMIDHTRDDLFRYAGAEQMRRKYLVQNRKTKQIYESFQIPYILVSAILFASYPKNVRMEYIKRFYDAISLHYLSLPTPIMAGLRTPEKQFSSCTKIDIADSLKGINAGAAAIVNYASKKAGIGVNLGRIRAEGQPVRNGDAVTTGVIPFAKYFNAALKSCSQGAVRGASASFNYPIWHLEFESLIQLKNERGSEDTRLRTVDYVVHLNKYLQSRIANNEDLYLFSPEEVPDLYEAFYSSNPEEFERLYEYYIEHPGVTKKTISALEAGIILTQERFETSRIYILFADEVNRQTSFYEPIYMTNLCVEVLLPTEPLLEDEGLIALCTLMAINWGKFTPFYKLNKEKAQLQTEKIREVCELAVRGLDALLSYQDYPEEAARRHVELYRPLGIGMIGFAHWLARGQLLWGKDDTLEEVETMMEVVAHSLTDTSITLAEEFGPCKRRTKYHDGIFPMDNSKMKANPKLDWGPLRERAKKHGIRNGSLMAFMPSETSSQISNATNGVEPPKSLVSNKGSKDGTFAQVVPEVGRLAPYYETSWNVATRDYLKTLGVIQIYNDQGISANTSYDSTAGQELTLGRLLGDIFYASSVGLPTLYYNNVNDGSGEGSADDGCESGACKI